MSAITPENVKLRDWISVGSNDAIVCHINENEPGKIEVVYLDYRNRAINRDAQYVDGQWTFVYNAPDGGYADNYSSVMSIIKSRIKSF
jgi:hypothetical protein